MKLLLDENLPNKLKYRFRDAHYDCYTVQDMDWASLTNGHLLAKISEHSFEALVTMDSNIGYQQNFNNYPIPVLVIIARSNTYETIMGSFDQILNALTNLQIGPNTIIIA